MNGAQHDHQGNQQSQEYAYPAPNRSSEHNGCCDESVTMACTTAGHPQSTTHMGCLVYSFGGCCGFTMFLILLLGIMVHIYWLGIFGFVSIAPGLCILWFLWLRQHSDTAFLTRIVKFVVFGMLGVIPVAIIESLITVGFSHLMESVDMVTIAQIFVGSFVNAFLIASLCEEAFKFLLAIVISVKPPRDVPYSVLVYSAAGAVGLATLENMMYIVVVGLRGSLFLTIFTAITRAVMAVPLHATTGVLIGADVAEKRFGVHNKNIFQILWKPFLLHGIYDFCTMFASAYLAANKDEYWIFFMPFLSLLTVIGGVWYARQRREDILRMETHYLPMTTITINV